jgi:hypothetical protein
LPTVIRTWQSGKELALIQHGRRVGPIALAFADLITLHCTKGLRRDFSDSFSARTSSRGVRIMPERIVAEK